MVHKQLLKKKEGIIIKTEEAPILLTEDEYERSKRRFKKSFYSPEMVRFLKVKR